MSNVVYLPQRLKLDGGGSLVIDMNARQRSIKAWEISKEYAKHKAALMYPAGEHREDAEDRIAHQHYREMMFP